MGQSSGTDAAPLPKSYDLGGVTATVVSGGGLKLDGGAMFGIIPKALWSRTTPADEQNRIQLACNCVLAEWAGGRRAIVETGHGEKLGGKDQQIFGIDPGRWLATALSELSVELNTIEDAIVTHLHFDHAGGLTRARNAEFGMRSETRNVELGTRNGRSEVNLHGDSSRSQKAEADPTGELATGKAPIDAQPIVATFPKSKVHVQRREHEDARANFGIMTATYREENFRAIDAVNAWQFHEGEATPLPGVRLIPTPGHTRGHQSVLIEGRDRAMLFLGDVMPTRNHVGPPYNMGYDLFPLDNRETKGRILRMAADREWLVVIDHDPVTPVVRVEAEGGWFRLTPA